MTGSACQLKSDSNGNFRLTGYSGRTYRLSASLTRNVDGRKVEHTAESAPFSLDGATPNVKLVLKAK